MMYPGKGAGIIQAKAQAARQVDGPQGTVLTLILLVETIAG